MTIPDTVEGAGAATRSPRVKGVTITVRLFPEIHGTVLRELARVPCGSRSARVIHLVTIGLMYEHACGNGRENAAFGPPSMSTSPIGSEPVAMRGDDLAFVSALTGGAES